MSKKVSIRYSRYLSLEQKKSLACSKAGQIGSAIRWSGHEKVKTKLVRIYESDYNAIRNLAAYRRTSISDAVSFAFVNCRWCDHSCSKKPAYDSSGV